MNVDYVARNCELDDRIRDFTEKKLRKVTKFLQEPTEIRVALEIEKHRHIAELHLAHRFGVVQATEETGNLYDSINLAVDKAEKQLRRSNKKFHARRRRGERETASWAMSVVDPASLGAADGPRVIRDARLEIESMSLAEAGQRLADATNDFVVFRDDRSGAVRVLYKRRDEHYGLIAPEV